MILTIANSMECLLPFIVADNNFNKEINKSIKSINQKSKNQKIKNQKSIKNICKDIDK